MKTEFARDRWLRPRLQGESLESRNLLSAVGFITRVIESDINAVSVYAADVDGDGDVDVLPGGGGWYENLDGQGSFGPLQVTGAEGNVWYVTDLDGDRDLDLLTSFLDLSEDTPAPVSKLAWFENVDGQGTFGPQHVIATLLFPVHSVVAADVDGDGDVDVFSRSGLPGIATGSEWHENTDGHGTFGSRHGIPDLESRAYGSIFAADVDGDGDVDVLSASRPFTIEPIELGDDKITWYENTDGKGAFGPQQVITTELDGARSVYAADVDDDGDLDVLSASSSDRKIAWYENTDGKGAFGPQQVITRKAAGAQSVYAADVDGDGDVDVLSASNKIAWYENTDGKGTFGPQQVITTKAAGAAQSVCTADVDGDGDVDVLSASIGGNRIAWYEVRLAGDTNDDGQVQLDDFVTLADNFGRDDAVWEQGDFDADGLVQFSDFVILANNFGKSRQPAMAPTLSSTLQATDTLSTANTLAADDLFERFDDELRLD